MAFFPNDLLMRIPALLIAITFHEYAHARMAFAWGDPTAKYQGRMTLNPLAHLDPIGLLMLILFRFGWARPVPINPFNFRDRRKGLFWVSLAGPGTNLLLGLLFTFVLFALKPSYPLVTAIFYNLIIYNIFLAVFNVIPLPPLDGSKILASLLPSRYLSFYQTVEPYGPFLLVILLVSGLLTLILLPVSHFIIDFFQRLALIFIGF